VNLLGAVTVGSPGFVRSLTIAGTATTGTGLNTSAAVSATGAITLTGHTNTDDYGINVGSAITSTVAGDVILSGRSGGTNASLPVRAIGINLTNAVSVAGGNLIIQGAALAGGVASPVSGSAATGSRHGFTSTAAGDLLASGSISVSGHSGNHIGANITGDIISTDGNVTLFGSGPYGMNIAGEVRAGSGSNLRSLTITGTGSGGYGVNGAAGGKLSATGSVAVTGYASLSGHAVVINNFVRSTVAGDIVFSAHAAGTGSHNGLDLNGPVTATNGGITIQGATLVGGVATPAPGTASTSRQSYGFTSAAVGTLTATGDIIVRTASIDRVVGAAGSAVIGAITSSLGNVSVIGSGVTGLSLQGPVSAGSGSTIRRILLSGYSDRGASVSGGGYGINAFNTATLTATGDVIINAYGDGATTALRLFKNVTSTGAGTSSSPLRIRRHTGPRRSTARSSRPTAASRCKARPTSTASSSPHPARRPPPATAACFSTVRPSRSPRRETSPSWVSPRVASASRPSVVTISSSGAPRVTS
jgi:hypothetical protein